MEPAEESCLDVEESERERKLRRGLMAAGPADEGGKERGGQEVEGYARGDLDHEREHERKRYPKM